MSDTQPGTGSRFVFDVTDATFEQDVIERSQTVPIVVDFWAPWCGPCKTLGPALEKLAAEHAGDFLLAKVNVDENPQIAGALGVRSIPFVIGLREGQIAAEFVGAVPEPQIRDFLRQILPSEADELAEEGAALAAGGDAAGAEACFRSALAKRSGHVAASLGLARVFASEGKKDDALALLDTIVAEGAVALEITQLRARLELAGEARGDLAELRARVAADARDLRARIDLGIALCAEGDYAGGLEELLTAVKQDPKFADEEARKKMVDVFLLLGRQDELVDRYQRELSRHLYR